MFLLAAITAAGPLTIDLYLPAYPDLAADFGVAEAQVQLTLTACVMGLALGQLLIGPISDRVGRRLPVVVGMALWSVSSLLCAFAPTLLLLTVGRFVQGFVVAAGMVTARAILRDLSTGRDLARAFAKLFLVVGAVPMIAPVVGSFVLQLTTWRGVFVLIAAIGVVMAVVTAFVLPETLPAHARSPVPARRLAATYGSLMVDRSFIAPAMMASLAFAGLFVWINGSSFVLQEEYQVSTLAYGMVFAVATAALIVGSQLSSALTGRFGLLPVVRTAPAAAAVVMLAVPSAALVGRPVPFGVVIGAVAVAMFCLGAAMPAASAAALSSQPPARAGLASGLVGVLQFAVGGLLSPLASIGGGVTAVSMATLMVMLFVASAVVARWIQEDVEADA